MEDVPATKASAPLDLAPSEQTMTNRDNESSDEYCEETDTGHPSVELLGQFQQLKYKFSSLKSTTYQSTPTAELT